MKFAVTDDSSQMRNAQLSNSPSISAELKDE
jgi:hypothetical protein